MFGYRIEENFGSKTLVNGPYCRVGEKNLDLAADLAEKNFGKLDRVGEKNL